MNGEPMPSLTAFGDGARFHHVGAVVSRIEDQGLDLTPIHDPIQRVRVAFIDLAGMTVELIEAAAGDSPVRRSLEKGGKLLHLCFEVPDLAAAISSAADHGFRSLGPPRPAVAFGGRRIAWCFSPVFGLIELLEREQHR